MTRKVNILAFRIKISLIHFIVVLILLFQEDILAQTATKSETKVLAENLVNKSFFYHGGLKGAPGITIEKTDSIIYDGKTIGYFYQYQPYGYVLIPKFKEINPYFAFSINGKLNLDPYNFIASFLKEELILRYLAVKGNKLQKETILNNLRQWKGNLVKGLEIDNPIQIPEIGTTSTGGLIETTWGQSSIYNDYCPIDPVTNIQSLTGCVGTAMAQVVNYWGNLTGTPLSVNFSETDNYTYNIDPGNGSELVNVNINATTASLSNITYPLSIENIGRLNFACGVSVKMSYTSSASSAATSSTINAFINKFGFYSAERLQYDENFHSMLYSNIENGLPCLLAIRDASNNGHSIVCDGLIDDGTTVRFHLNYGWDGLYAEPTLFYEVPSNLPANYTTIGYGVVNIKKKSTITNNPPNKPTLTNPPNGSNQSYTFNLSWQCTDPDVNDVLNYSVKVRIKGTTSWDIKYVNTNTFCEISRWTSADLNTYEWCVVADDGKSKTTSEIREYTLVAFNSPPDKPLLLTPTNGSNVGRSFTYSWQCSDQDIDDVLNYTLQFRAKGIIHWLKAPIVTNQFIDISDYESGTYEWCIVASDGKAENTSDIWEFTVSPSTFFRNIENNSKINIYPNPTKDFFTIDLELSESKSLNIELIDTKGDIIYKESIKSPPQFYIRQLNISDKKAGTYFIKITVNNSIYIKKVMIE
jgi:hypothetical protein